VGAHDGIEGIKYIRDVVLVDQSPIGRSPRSNPITYIRGFDPIRSVFASTRDAAARGYNRSTFSFNLAQGRCPVCKGEGALKIEMHFLADIYVPCEECNGKRYKPSVLEVKCHGQNISDVLDMTVEQAIDFFREEPPVLPLLYLLHEVGLGYLKLGQPANTLSGGEAQRLKIAREISNKNAREAQLCVIPMVRGNMPMMESAAEPKTRVTMPNNPSNRPDRRLLPKPIAKIVLNTPVKISP